MKIVDAIWRDFFPAMFLSQILFIRDDILQFVVTSKEEITVHFSKCQYFYEANIFILTYSIFLSPEVPTCAW